MEKQTNKQTKEFVAGVGAVSYLKQSNYLPIGAF